MKNRLKFLCILFFLVIPLLLTAPDIPLVVSAWQQVATTEAAIETVVHSKPKTTNGSKVDQVVVKHPFPFQVGESLTFEFKFSRFPIYGTIGQLNMNVVPVENLTSEVKKDDPSPIPASKSSEQETRFGLQALAESKGFIPALFGLKVRDTFTSVVDLTDFSSLYMRKDIDEGKKHKKQVSLFHREKPEIHFSETDLSVANAQAAARTIEGVPWTTDLLSFWYMLRMQPFKEGETIPMVLYDDGKIFNVDVVVGKSEKISVEAGKYTARKLIIKAHEAQFIRRKGEYLIWISEDKNRLPVKVRFRTSSGTLTAELVKKNIPSLK
ncbi:MAG TPA: DUF3108 domain-containing protein [Acidobacteriota bacterium]|nr:DUF3108 domain-containing protein [Acidobacteriota bacterium]